MKPVLFYLVGLPASGKSTFAKSLVDNSFYPTRLFSSDALRQELWGDESIQGNNQQLFAELNRRVKECLKEGNDAIYDATNIDFKKRKAFCEELKKIDCVKICCVIATPYTECLERNKRRSRVVPEYVIDRMYKNFTVPYWYEGWDDILIVTDYEDAMSPMGFIKHVMSFDQHNHHHALSLGQHCLEALKSISNQGYVEMSTDNKSPLTDFGIATLIHDNGKVYCKDFHNAKGEVTEEAHYYNHQYCGAYNSLFFSDIQDHLYVAQLIQWHMHPYVQWKDSEKRLNKDKELLGEELFNDIMILHKADVEAH